jgi:hypothetical protein
MKVGAVVCNKRAENSSKNQLQMLTELLFWLVSGKPSHGVY